MSYDIMRAKPTFFSFFFLICVLNAQSFSKNSLSIKEYQMSSEKYISGPDGKVYMNVNFWGTTNAGKIQVQEGIDFASLMSLVGGPSQFSNLKKIRLYRETPDENGKMVYIIDLTSFLKSGDRSNFPKIKPNDTIVIKKTLIGILIFKNFMIKTSLARLFTILSIISAVLYLPSILMYYGIHEITSVLTNGMVDAQFIAILNTAAESPLSQIAMIPLLAWIAKNAPIKYKATFFAVFASFTNLALSASALGTKYLNEIFNVTREVKDKVTNEIQSTADYTELGILLIVTTLLTLVLPILFVFIINKTKYQTSE